jgi:hypothetical protein
MNSTDIIIYLFINYFIFNYVIIKIHDRKVKHQSNIEIFFETTITLWKVK